MGSSEACHGSSDRLQIGWRRAWKEDTPGFKLRDNGGLKYGQTQDRLLAKLGHSQIQQAHGWWIIRQRRFTFVSD